MNYTPPTVAASKQAKEAGLKNLTEVSEMSKTPYRTLLDWHKTRPRLFQIILFGCAKVKESNNG